jgi:hypothetical protein
MPLDAVVVFTRQLRAILAGHQDAHLTCLLLLPLLSMLLFTSHYYQTNRQRTVLISTPQFVRAKQSA